MLFKRAQKGERMTEEFEMEFEDKTAYILRELVEEGKFRDISEAVSYAWETRFEEADGLDTDPGLDQRISELNLIYSNVKDETLRDFFTETSYLTQQYARLAHDHDREDHFEEAEEYMAELNRVLANPNLPETDVQLFLDSTVEMTDSFWNLSSEVYAGWEGTISEYEDSFDDDELEELLMDQ